MRHHLFPSILLLLGALALLAGCQPVTPSPVAHDQSQAAAVIKVANADDAVAVYAQTGTTFVDITSPRGIGSAQVQFTPAQAAGPIQLRFYLKGLEQALLDNGDMQLEIGISSHPPYLVSQTVITSNGARSLDKDDALRADVTLASAEGAPATIPLHSGQIAITLPATLIDARRPVLSLRWVDFYR